MAKETKLDVNGKRKFDGAYTADLETAQATETLVSSLELTDRQATILKLRLQGYGYKAIATYLGISQRGVAKHCALMQTKWNELHK